MFTIVTCGDSKYFEFLHNFENNVFDTFGYYPVIYDLGLKESQIKSLKSEIQKINIEEEFWKLDINGYIKATHKPLCIKDILEKKKVDCIYIDSDTIFTSKLFENKFHNVDIAITPRHKKEQKQEYYINGLINSGFIFFKNSKNTKSIVEKWIIACKETNTTDQKALSDILKEQIDILYGKSNQQFDDTKILLLDPEIYNDVSCKTGIIFHFKNAARREKSLKKYRKFVVFQKRFTILVRTVVKLRRFAMKIIRQTVGNEHRFRED